MGLNLKQRKAVETTEGPLLIIAGPGSGKTFTLVERIHNLITNKNISAENILVATFTEKAAQELITRVSNRLQEEGIPFNVNEMYLGTIHSICLRILEENREFTRLKKNFIVMDQFDQQYFLYQRIYDYKQLPDVVDLIGHNTSRWKAAELLLKWINKVSEEILDIKQLKNSSNPKVKAIGYCYELYQQHLKDENALDFSTIQLEAYYLLKNHPQINDQLNEKLHYLMIDEYQDTNTIQEKIIFMLGGKLQNICVVGDDDQGLYRFRGATIRNILEFPKKFKDKTCERVELSLNYRSHPSIIEFYNGWMNQHNWSYKGKYFRYNKQIEASQREHPKGKSVIKVSGSDGLNNWEEEVYEFLIALREEGKLTDWNQVAFLFQSVKNNKVIALANYLEERNIPVYSPRSNMFFERHEIRLLIGAFMFLFPQFPHIRKWKEDAYLPEWELYDQCLREFGTELRKSENQTLLEWCRLHAREHMGLTKNTDYSFAGLFYQLLQFNLFKNYLEQGSYNVRDSRSARNLSLFSKILTKFEYLHRLTVFTPETINYQITTFFNHFLRFLINGGINEYEDKDEYAPSGCVSFLTIHQSKGLEFPIVVVGSLDKTPTKQYSELDEVLQDKYYHKEPFEPLEYTKYYDFWRLYYTAFSRAQNLLVLSCQENLSIGQGTRNVPTKPFVDLYDTLTSWRQVNNIYNLDIEKVRKGSIKREYSFTSHINVFETCALQYNFYKELNFSPVRQGATLFGTLVHQTIEDIHKSALRGEEDKIIKGNIEEWFSANYNNLIKKERIFLAPQTQRAALKQVLQYVKKQNNNWTHIREAEVDISLVKENYILKGTIDLIQGKDNTVEIIDFKSEKKPDLVKEADMMYHYKRQLEVYAYLIEERTGYQVSKMHIYYTGEEHSNPYVTFSKDTSAINQTISTFDRIVKRIEDKDFTIKNRPTRHCRNCDMRFYCNENE
ncbi:ATP-dependent DNA helicase [Priestia endophytica]|uniref:DNA 3'-5' helicase n=1 Tax=Priestia endophytica DSM 13796 TaxID=1121089 RepID=A0A1I5YPC7_9BACI|nr:ATP-dependent DNA helicase [Priestia endophytica]KYG33625.1 DNA helicase UvrD [Priestia endophytica]SFQ46099.1 DNA helicase-2 / ATP-dependent DNA helicase PcrA [Priestia endophytica DSM 13796]